MSKRFRVERYDYAAQYADCDGTLVTAIRELLLTGGYILGEPVSVFEKQFARYLDCAAQTVSVNSGTDALILALRGLGVGAGDEVITVANTFYSTVLAIRQVGATPVLVDCRPDSFLIDIAQVEACISDRTRVILPVHLYGQAVDMAPVRAVADKYGLLIVEDCAQAVGATSNGIRVGAASDAACWSFGPAKNLAAAGDAGAITVQDSLLADRLRQLRHLGQRTQNVHELLGYNSRLDSIQALILSHKLPQLDTWNSARVKLAHSYRQRLTGLPLRFQEGARAREHVFHLFQIGVGDQRDNLLSYLRTGGIDAVVRYPYPIHLQEAFRDLGYRAGQFPAAEELATQNLCLPLHPSMGQDSIEYVCDRVNQFFGGSLMTRQSSKRVPARLGSRDAVDGTLAGGSSSANRRVL